MGFFKNLFDPTGLLTGSEGTPGSQGMASPDSWKGVGKGIGDTVKASWESAKGVGGKAKDLMVGGATGAGSAVGGLAGVVNTVAKGTVNTANNMVRTVVDFTGRHKTASAVAVIGAALLGIKEWWKNRKARKAQDEVAMPLMQERESIVRERQAMMEQYGRGNNPDNVSHTNQVAGRTGVQSPVRSA